MADQVDHVAGGGGSRAERKRAAILEAAGEVFLREGYVGTSMDEVASVASVSKQTVYKHFGDKGRLFVELVTSIVTAASDPVSDEVGAVADSDDVATDLRELAERLLTRVIRTEVLDLRRLVIGEARRFPELARTFHELGPQRTIDALAEAFASLAARGALSIEDPVVAAEHFNWLVVSTPLNRAMFLPDAPLPDTTVLADQAEAAVATFLAAHPTA